MLSQRGRPLRRVPSSPSVETTRGLLTPAVFRLLMLALFAAAVAALGYLDVRMQLQQAKEGTAALEAKLARERQSRLNLTRKYKKLLKRGKGSCLESSSAHVSQPASGVKLPQGLNATGTPSILLGQVDVPLWTEATAAADGPSTMPFIPTNSCLPGGLGLARELYPVPRRFLDWNPRPDRFLIALCYYGRMTNNLMCIQRYMGFAALLNRTLLVPMKSISSWTKGLNSKKVPTINMAFDMGHAQSCLGPGRLFPLEGYLHQQKRAVMPVAVWRWVSTGVVTWDDIQPNVPYLRLILPDGTTSIGKAGGGRYSSQSRRYAGGMDAVLKSEARRREAERRTKRIEERAERLRQKFRGHRTQERRLLWEKGAAGGSKVVLVQEPRFRKSPIWYKEVTLKKFLDAFGSLQDEAISLGDVFLVEGDETIPGLYEGPNGPFKPIPPCQLIIQPSHLFLKAAEQFVSSTLGGNFIAIHLRRTDFSSHCMREGFNCWFSLRQLAECVAARLSLPEVRHSNVSTIYLATDAPAQECSAFKEMVLALAPQPFIFVRLTREMAKHISGVDLLRNAEGFLLSDGINFGLFEKLVCLHSRIFWGSLRSTFSKDVLRMRLGLGMSHCLDHYICQDTGPEALKHVPSLGAETQLNQLNTKQ